MNPYVAPSLPNLPSMQTQVENRSQRLTNKRKEGIDKMRQIAVQADRIRNIPDFITQRTEAIKMAREAIVDGGNPESWQPVIDAQNKDEMDLQLTKLFTQNIDSSKYLEHMMQAETERLALANTKWQFSGQELMKDAKNEFYFATTRRDPISSNVEPVITPLVGNNKPVLPLTKVSSIGLNPSQQIAHNAENARQQREAQLGQELDFAGRIEEAKQRARANATNLGTAELELAEMEAALPTLRESINEMKSLAPHATYTMGGRFFDALVRETGFGATQGSTARAKYISILRNQVLPLLKPTFGSAFTVQEGEKLEATFGDPNLTPEQKIAALEAKLSQFERDIRTKAGKVKIYQSKQVDNDPSQSAPVVAPPWERYPGLTQQVYEEMEDAGKELFP